MDIKELLQGLTPDKLQDINKMLATREGRALMEKIKNTSKDELIKKAESAGLANLSKDELIKKLNSDKKLLKQLNQFLDRK